MSKNRFLFTASCCLLCIGLLVGLYLWLRVNFNKPIIVQRGPDRLHEQRTVIDWREIVDKPIILERGEDGIPEKWIIIKTTFERWLISKDDPEAAFRISLGPNGPGLYYFRRFDD